MTLQIEIDAEMTLKISFSVLAMLPEKQSFLIGVIKSVYFEGKFERETYV